MAAKHDILSKCIGVNRLLEVGFQHLVLIKVVGSISLGRFGWFGREWFLGREGKMRRLAGCHGGKGMLVKMTNLVLPAPSRGAFLTL
jgi:hypothetical protein